ncbi:glycoside hydrolase family 16 protein [Biscogniauxia marginata]|nr:glycoside hydrolase family 16 protein [Biscogniauxia marginata]
MAPRSLFVPALTLLSSIFSSSVTAQLTSDCNPLERDDCPANPAFGTEWDFIFNETQPDGVFNTTAGKVEYDPETGAAFTIHKQGESPTLSSNFYFFFGRTEVHLKAAPGTGIVSSIVWSSDILDEVDWEFLGGNKTHASTNYFGKGIQDFHNAGYHEIAGGVQDNYVNYTCTWTKEKMEWWADNQLVRTLMAEDANNTLNYPQTPMKLSIGIWAGGDPSMPEGTRAWAGGDTNFDEAPFTMYVKSAHVEDYSSGKEYVYGDKSGTWESIKVVSGNSTAFENLHKEPEKSLGEKWAELPSSTKAGVYAASAGVGGLLFAALVVYYFKQRRSGQREAAALAAQQEQDRVELERFQKEGRNPDSYQDYDAVKGGMTTNPAYTDSPPASSAGPPEKTWDPTNNTPSSPTMPTHAGMPLLHDGSLGVGGQGHVTK